MSLAGRCASTKGREFTSPTVDKSPITLIKGTLSLIPVLQRIVSKLAITGVSVKQDSTAIRRPLHGLSPPGSVKHPRFLKIGRAARRKR